MHSYYDCIRAMLRSYTRWSYIYLCIVILCFTFHTYSRESVNHLHRGYLLRTLSTATTCKSYTATVNPALRVHISLTPCTAKFNNGISWLSGNPGTSGSDNSALYQRALYWRRALVTWSGLVPGIATRSTRVTLIYRQNNLNKLSCWCSRNVYGN